MVEGGGLVILVGATALSLALFALAFGVRSRFMAFVSGWAVGTWVTIIRIVIYEVYGV